MGNSHGAVTRVWIALVCIGLSSGCVAQGAAIAPSIYPVPSAVRGTPIGQTRVHGINVYLHQVQDRALVEVGTLFTYREDWLTRFLNAGMTGASAISGCSVSRPAQDLNTLNRVGRLPFRFWVELQC